jgi:N-hydroxyarylamine O-acetyltransferase
VDLSPGAVFTKLVDQRRGGWCFEQNLLLGMALRHLGLPVTEHAGQVIWHRPPGQGGPRTHRLLLVAIEGRRWIADVGFGAVTLTDLLAFEPDIEQPTSHETFRLAREDDAIWRVEVRLPDGWRTTYRFDLAPWWIDDFGPVNYQLSHDPASQFVRAVNAARVLPHGRLGLRDADFTRRALDGRGLTTRLRDVPEMLDVLDAEFGIDARGLPGIRERLAACFVPPEGGL